MMVDMMIDTEKTKTGDTAVLTAENKPLWQKFLPLVVLAGLVAAIFATGIHENLSFDVIALRYSEFVSYVDSRPLVSVLIAASIYAAATALSIPAAWLLTVTIGLVFGWALGAATAVIGATIGASILFFVTRVALADFFRARAGNVLNSMAAGFRDDSVSYMLFLRLAPIFPFTLVNVVPAILGVPFRIFFFTTAVGIIPGTIAYAYAGEGLRSIVVERAEACAANVAPCGEALSPGDLVTPQILIAFVLLGAVSLMPVVIKWVKRLRA